MEQSISGTRRDGWVDLQVFMAFEALKGCLDGYVSVVHHERRARTKPVSRRPDSGECLLKTEEMLKFWIRAHQETERWHATQVSNHGKLFPFSENLATLMFIVVSDQSEVPERDSQVPSLSRE